MITLQSLRYLKTALICFEICMLPLLIYLMFDSKSKYCEYPIIQHIIIIYTLGFPLCFFLEFIQKRISKRYKIFIVLRFVNFLVTIALVTFLTHKVNMSS